MTLGEKIHFYRNKIGLSQEELGQQLLVSRQTVSLWEMDKTMPTLDNLIRLKEIFHVSVDELLTQSEPEPTEPDRRDEPVRFTFNAAERKEIFRLYVSPVLRKTILFFVLSLTILMALLSTTAPDVLTGIGFGVFVLGTVNHLKAYLTFRKTYKKATDRLAEEELHYEIHDTFLIAKSVKNETVISLRRVDFADLDKIIQTDKYLILQSGEQSFLLKTEILLQSSPLHLHILSSRNKVRHVTLGGWRKTVRILLLVLSFLSPYLAMICEVILATMTGASMPECMCVFFLFTPIPIASVVFGVFQKKKGHPYKANLIVGIVLTALLCIYGSFSFAFSDTFSHSDALMVQAEQSIGLDLPTPSQIHTEDWTKGTQSVSGGYIYFISDLHFDDHTAEEFDRQIGEDDRWMTPLPSELTGITLAYADQLPNNGTIVYNVGTGEINRLPEEPGTYRFLQLIWCRDTKTLKLIDYEVEFQTQN